MLTRSSCTWLLLRRPSGLQGGQQELLTAASMVQKTAEQRSGVSLQRATQNPLPQLARTAQALLLQLCRMALQARALLQTQAVLPPRQRSLRRVLGTRLAGRPPHHLPRAQQRHLGTGSKSNTLRQLPWDTQQWCQHARPAQR